MNNIHLRSKDLNLLIILDTVLLERSTSRAAERLGLTQSAVSHALKRLRLDIGDDLLVRGSRGMVPTPLALRLQPKLAKAISELEGFYRVNEAFRPKEVEARLVVATTDYLEAALFPKLLQYLRREAPGLTIISRPAAGSLPVKELEGGAIDLAIAGYFSDLGEGLYSQRLFSDSFQSAVRNGHPRLRKDRLSMKAFVECEHLLISPKGDLKAQMDVELQRRGLSRRIVAGMSGFLSSAWIVAESDLVLTALARDLKSFSAYFPITIFPTPIELHKVHTSQVWHERTHRSPLHRWFRTAIEKAASYP